MKPDVAAYRAVEERTGTDGPEIVLFDDTLENIEAARSLGWIAHHIDHDRDTAGQMRAVLSSLSILGPG